MARVFVGNLPTSVQERDLESEFDKFGRIRSISVKFPQRPPPFAFIEYEDERDASDAVRAMHGREFHGSRLRVEISHGGGAVRGGESGLDSRLRGTQFRVKISNLPTNVSWQDLKDFLRDGGDVAHADVDRRGNGVASFATFEDMDRAIRKLDDTEFSGERIRIREDRNDSGDTGSRSGGGGGGRRRSRSRSRSRSWSRSRSRSRSPLYRSRHGRSYSRSPSPLRRSSRRRSSRSRSR